MKFSLPITILAVAASVDAAALTADLDKRYCEADGQACNIVKRATTAFSNAIQENHNLVTRDITEGETSVIAARQLRELALAIAASHDNPAAFYQALGFKGEGANEEAAATRTKRDDIPNKVQREASPWCTQFLGMPCWKREANPNPEAEPFCAEAHGQPCWTRRSAPVTPVTPAVPDRVKRAPEPWCIDFLGQPCWKKNKREAAPEPAPVEDANHNTSIDKREASPEAEPEPEPDRYCTRFTGSSCWKRDETAETLEQAKRCTSEGQACWKAKRAAAAVINAIDEGSSLKARQFEIGWCREFLGMPCWKRDVTCHGPAGVCTKATRDLHAMYNAARAIIEA
ncbi:hypothetical protein B0J18DRAFT_245175 [Chaetomium sp. MPI-SDFR-AT-0129]|nr:hypothetical protein B0J18DRAFT_245175 [Chaetomium sp. MPI-SDFR-AT-0129]